MGEREREREKGRERKGEIVRERVTEGGEEGEGQGAGCRPLHQARVQLAVSSNRAHGGGGGQRPAGSNLAASSTC